MNPADTERNEDRIWNEIWRNENWRERSHCQLLLGGFQGSATRHDKDMSRKDWFKYSTERQCILTRSAVSHKWKIYNTRYRFNLTKWTVVIYHIIQMEEGNLPWCWRDGSAVRNTCCSCLSWEHRLGPQHPHSVSQPSYSSSSGPDTLLWLLYILHAHDAQIFMQANHSYT